MYRFRMELAGTTAEVDALYESSREFCKDYITEKPAELSIAISEADIEKELSFATAESPSAKDLESMALYRKLCTELAFRDTVLIHGSCVAVDGQAYLFCAPSGTGKSTHTRLWRRYLRDRAVMINDDKPLVRIVPNSDAGKDGGLKAMIYGTPWNGKHRLGTNMSAPLKAICFLERGEENSIERFNAKDAIPMLMKYTFRPEDPAAMMQVLDTAAKISGLCAFWTLKCNMDPQAAEVSFKAMSEA